MKSILFLSFLILAFYSCKKENSFERPNTPRTDSVAVKINVNNLIDLQ